MNCVFEMIDWTAEVISAVIGSSVASIDDGVVPMIDGFVRDTDEIGKIIEELKGADVTFAFNAFEGSVVVVGLSVDSIVKSSSNVDDIAIGCSGIRL